MSPVLDDRFWSKVNKTESCWVWTAAKTAGYGRYWLAPSLRQAYRLTYEAFVGPIPEGLVIDHLCRNKACVRPDHLEAVTDRVNLHRGNTLPAMHAGKTHCIHGHEFTPENTHLLPQGWRRCLTCHQSRKREYRARKATA